MSTDSEEAHFHPPVTLPAWPSADRRSRVVFIVRDLDEAMLRDTLALFTDPPCDRAAEGAVPGEPA